MKYSYSKGTHTRQAHTSIPEGTYEEELGRDGFFGDQVQFYRLNPNTNWTRIEGPLQPHSIQSYDLLPDSQFPSFTVFAYISADFGQMKTLVRCDKKNFGAQYLHLRCG